MPTKAVDEAFEAFERLFGYKWGTTFGLDADPSGAKNTKTDTTYSTTTKRKLTQIFGEERAARILGTKGNHTKKRRKLESLATSIENFKDLVLPVLQQETTVETQVFAGQTIQTTKKKAAGTASKTIKSAPKSSIDNVLEQINGPSKINTVQKTSNDWEQLKESDQQLKDELEKKAQGKDAFLVKQDFLSRVDQRKFEIEKKDRSKERFKRDTS